MKSIACKNNKLLTTLFICFQLLFTLSDGNKIFSAEVFINKEASLQNLKNNKKNENIKDSYLLGAGDVIYINFLDVPFLNRTYTIPQEGYLNLPEINGFKFEGKTIQEVENELKTAYNEVLYDSNVQVNIISYRALNIYVRGEVSRPGLYTFSGLNTNNIISYSSDEMEMAQVVRPNVDFKKVSLFETIAKAQGVSNYADLSNVIVFRNNSKTKGGGRIKASINLLSLIENGDQSQNIRMFDGDTVYVPKGKMLLKDQILKISKSNLSPELITIFVTGNVENPGKQTLGQGSSLNQAIANSGGRKIFSGKVNFIRFNADGTTTKRSFNYSESAPINSKKNPILMSGDILDVNRSIFGNANYAISEVTRPIINSVGLYKLFQ